MRRARGDRRRSPVRWIAAALLAAAGVGLGGPSAAGAESQRIGLDAVPSVAHAGDRIVLAVRVWRDVGVPPNLPEYAARRMRPQPATLRIETADGTVLAEREVAIPPFRDRAATAVFPVAAGDYAGTTLAFVLRRIERDVARAELRIARIRTFDGTLVPGADGLRDGAGRRVLLLVPEGDPSGARRWLPLRFLLGAVGRERTASESGAGVESEAAAEGEGAAAGEPGEVLLVGARLGDGTYAAELERRIAARGRRLRTVFAEPGGGYPVERLLAAAVRARAAHGTPEAVLLFPGSGDVREGTPLGTVVLALEACAALFQDGPAGTIVLATPPPAGGPGRAVRAYREGVRTVARRRVLRVADLGLEADAGRILDRHPGTIAQRRIASRLERALHASRAFWLFTAGGGGLLLGAGAALWLWRRARFEGLAACLAADADDMNGTGGTDGRHGRNRPNG
jgi:hypothetical protein